MLVVSSMPRSTLTMRSRYLPAATVLRNGVCPRSRPFNEIIAHGRTRTASSPFRAAATGDGALREGGADGVRVGSRVGSLGGGASLCAGPLATGVASTGSGLGGLVGTKTAGWARSGEHTSELQSRVGNSYAVF